MDLRAVGVPDRPRKLNSAELRKLGRPARACHPMTVFRLCSRACRSLSRYYYWAEVLVCLQSASNTVFWSKQLLLARQMRWDVKQ